jgi:hypothetical protein
MGDRRRVGLVDHSDQREGEKISRAVKEGFLICRLPVAAAGPYFRKLEELHTLARPEGSVGIILCTS